VVPEPTDQLGDAGVEPGRFGQQREGQVLLAADPAVEVTALDLFAGEDLGQEGPVVDLGRPGAGTGRHLQAHLAEGPLP
jgi:hypothetical protein